MTRLQRDFLRKCIHWSADLGPIRFGHVELQELLGKQSWKLVELESANDQEKEEGEEDVQSLQCDTVVHMALAEKPDKILEFLKTLPPPKPEEIKRDTRPPADRDALLTRSLLVFCAVENLRDANILLRSYVEQVEDRPIDELAKSYMNKEDGFAPSHAVFGVCCCVSVKRIRVLVLSFRGRCARSRRNWICCTSHKWCNRTPPRLARCISIFSHLLP